MNMCVGLCLCLLRCYNHSLYIVYNSSIVVSVNRPQFPRCRHRLRFEFGYAPGGSRGPRRCPRRCARHSRSHCPLPKNTPRAPDTAAIAGLTAAAPLPPHPSVRPPPLATVATTPSSGFISAQTHRRMAVATGVHCRRRARC